MFSEKINYPKSIEHFIFVDIGYYERFYSNGKFIKILEIANQEKKLKIAGQF